MVKVKVTAVTDLKNSDLIDVIQNTVDVMTGDPVFATPSPSLGVIQTALDNLDALEVESQNRARGVVALKRTARATLIALFKELCLYINFTLRNNPNAGDVIAALGLEVAQTGGHPVGTPEAPVNAKSEVSEEPGSIDLSWEAPQGGRGVHSFVIEITDGSDTPESVWRQVATSTTTKYCVSGLDRGNFYSFRIRAVGAKSVYSAPSEATTCVAG